jgi:hypothetical protein
MPNQEEVEKFKITPEMRGFLKTYKKFNEVGTRLRNKMQIHLDEAAKTRQMLAQVEEGMKMLTLNAPEKPTFEVAGQDDTGESQAQQPQEQERQTMNPMIQY